VVRVLLVLVLVLVWCGGGVRERGSRGLEEDAMSLARRREGANARWQEGQTAGGPSGGWSAVVESSTAAPADQDEAGHAAAARSTPAARAERESTDTWVPLPASRTTALGGALKLADACLRPLCPPRLSSL
jgi:hypothetical protein